MATRRASTAAKKTAPKPPPAPEPEEELEELEEEEFEEVDETSEPTTTPTKGKTRSAETVVFGVAHLAEYLTQKSGKPITTRELRTLIRRMARDGKNRVQREIVAGNRSRYDWPLGLKDPEVQAIVKAFLAGESESAKKEALVALKERNAAKRAAAPTKPAAKPTAKKAAAKPIVEETDEDDEELEFEDED